MLGLFKRLLLEEPDEILEPTSQKAMDKERGRLASRRRSSPSVNKQQGKLSLLLFCLADVRLNGFWARRKHCTFYVGDLLHFLRNFFFV